MRNDTSQPIIKTLLAQAAQGRSWRTKPSAAPAATYADPEWLAAERRTLFGPLPQVVALSPDLPEPGSYLTRDNLAVPLLVIRGDDGVVRAFANVCAHRGAEVVGEERGCSRRFSCAYHAWTYGTDGRLVGLPDRDAFPDIDTPGPGLRTLPTVEDHGVIWVTPDPAGGPTPRPELGPIADDLDSFDIGAHRHWRSHRFDLALNWKLVIDTFLEPYHFASLHKNTVGPLFIPNLCFAERFGPHVREVLPRRTLTELGDQPPEQWDLVPHTALVYVLFPNTVFVMQIDHVETWRVTPDPQDPGRSVCDLDFYIPDVPTNGPTGERQISEQMSESAARHWERNWKLTIDTVIEEDFAAMAGAQRGLASGALDQLRFGSNEPALTMFHEAVADAVDGRDPQSEESHV